MYSFNSYNGIKAKTSRLPMVHAGSWFGLPDFGITEALTSNRTAQGGSNLIGPQPKPAVQAPVSNNVQYGPQAVYGPTAVSGARTSSGGGGAVAPQQQAGGPPQIPTPGQPQIDFDALIAPALAGLDAAIGPLQQGYDSDVQSINSARTNQIASTNANIAGQQNTLSQAKSSQEGQARNAADEARRQYAEIQQGLQSRYGGTTGTGAFASELAGRQTLQNMGQTREQLSSAILQIDQKKQQVEEVGRIAIQDIEDRTRDNLNQAKNQLDSALADIRRQKGELQSRKAELAANAVQIYQNTVNQVNQQNAAFKQNLYLAQMQAGQKLDAALQQGNSATTDFSQNLGSINAAQQTTPIGAPQQPTQPGVAGSGGGLQFNSGNEDLFKKLEQGYLGL